MDLREEASAQDASDVISLIKHSLMDTFSDEFGNIELSRSINGSGVSSRNKVLKYKIYKNFSFRLYQPCNRVSIGVCRGYGRILDSCRLSL